MKTVLCFGDSNTYGYIPGSQGERYSAVTDAAAYNAAVHQTAARDVVLRFNLNDLICGFQHGGDRKSVV